jgi:hypothetical protein
MQQSTGITLPIEIIRDEILTYLRPKPKQEQRRIYRQAARDDAIQTLVSRNGRDVALVRINLRDLRNYWNYIDGRRGHTHSWL